MGLTYPGAGRPVLRPLHFAIGRTDRILLEGPSGGGKSTLASLIIGMRQPTVGTVLLDGVDRHAWGMEGWRQRITGAPQFHRNHLLAGTLAFNLLLGRRWPPTPDDLDAADRVCRELGLGDLLDRMPAGLQQLVGETGWQLSHGERSRVFLARALLQDADLVVLDESFGGPRSPGGGVVPAPGEPPPWRVGGDRPSVRCRTQDVPFRPPGNAGQRYRVPTPEVR